jgi:tritrans,polycis-undecaprenyl-diphosphate synthase [geranylgeranyl-diphosphate specific]
LIIRSKVCQLTITIIATVYNPLCNITHVGRSLLVMIRGILSLLQIYRIYEWYLGKQIDPSRLPNHIGIIMDGNRRWADSVMVDMLNGYSRGADKVYEVVNWCIDMGIKQITLYILSTENLKRRKEDIDAVLKILEDRLDSLYTDSKVYAKRMRIMAIGRLELLPERIRYLISRLEEATRAHDRYYITLAVAYGGRSEILESIRSIAFKVKEGSLDPEDIDEKVIEDHLYTKDLPKQEPDLIIRTSGEVRLSGFLLWQSAYSELVFIDIPWPEFRRIDLLRAIRTYQSRRRRFGL